MGVRGWPRAAAAHEMLLSEVADYELRRELRAIDSRRSFDRLDELTRELRYIPVTTATWRAAARLWALQRKAGRATAAEGRLNGEVLIAAQALAEDAIIVTPNTRHFDFAGTSGGVARGLTGTSATAKNHGLRQAARSPGQTGPPTPSSSRSPGQTGPPTPSSSRSPGQIGPPTPSSSRSPGQSGRRPTFRLQVTWRNRSSLVKSVQVTWTKQVPQHPLLPGHLDKHVVGPPTAPGNIAGKTPVTAGGAQQRRPRRRRAPVRAR
jgi:predicted nucleic acid-binding protein